MKRTIVLCGIVLILLALLVSSRVAIKAPVLPPDADAAVEVRPGGLVAVTQRGKPPRAVYVPPEGHVSVVVPRRGSAPVVHVKRAGFCVSPAAAAGVGTDLRLRVGVLAKLAYAGRWGVGVGLVGPRVDALGYVEYQPARWFGNTQVWLGRGIRGTTCFGLKIRF